MSLTFSSVTIAGFIDFDPAACPAVLLDAKLHIEAARAEPGCLAYNWAFDPLVPGRVHVFEEWASEESLHAHFRSEPYRRMGAHLAAAGMKRFEIKMFGVAVAEPVYDEAGKPRAVFFADRR